MSGRQSHAGPKEGRGGRRPVNGVKLAAAALLLALAAAGHACSKDEPANRNAGAAQPAGSGQANGAAQAGGEGELAALRTAAARDLKGLTFKHEQHIQLKCDECHVRRADAVTPVVPGHSACIACHVKEFTQTGFAFCNNCHDGIREVRPAVLPFPERHSYGTEFSHVTHATVQGGERRADCDQCHQVAGARATLPAHRECYQCHKAPDQLAAGEKAPPGTCGTCHTNSPTASRKQFAAPGSAYRYRFSHAAHLRAGQRCTDCHKVLGEGAIQVSLPKLSEHTGAGFAKSCGSCHNGRVAFSGEIEANQCARCHGRPMM